MRRGEIDDKTKEAIIHVVTYNSFMFNFCNGLKHHRARNRRAL